MQKTKQKLKLKMRSKAKVVETDWLRRLRGRGGSIDAGRQTQLVGLWKWQFKNGLIISYYGMLVIPELC